MAILFAKTKQGTVEGKPGWNRAISLCCAADRAKPLARAAAAGGLARDQEMF